MVHNMGFDMTLGYKFDEILDRKLAPETARSHKLRWESNFYAHYMSGKGLDIGFRGDQPNKFEVQPVLPSAEGIDLGYKNYDGINLPHPTGSQSYVYSSHMLEHLELHKAHLVIKEWYRVTQTDGHIIIIVPHRDLYERKYTQPSYWNADHKEFYTAARLLTLVENTLTPNSYRVRHLVENDRDYNYDIPPDRHPSGCYEIELVIQKIRVPTWKLQT